MNKRDFIEQYVERAKSVHGNKYDYSRISYKNVTSKVEILCPDHGSFFQSLYHHVVKSTKCPSCARFNDKLSLTDFIHKSRNVHGDKYDYSKVVYVDVATPVTIICKAHGEFLQRAGSHLQGVRCRQCHIESTRLGKKAFIEKAMVIHGDKYDYSKVVYTGNKKPVEVICPNHGSFFIKPNSHISSKGGCTSCRESKGETAVKLFLQKYSIPYIKEYKIHPYFYRYDFLIPELNILIEFNGIQHYRPVDKFGGVDAYTSTCERDIDKALVAKANGFKLIILKYTCLVNNTLEDELIYFLKRIYTCWYRINGKNIVFKTELDAYKFFNIDLRVAVKDLHTEIAKAQPGLQVLF